MTKLHSSGDVIKEIAEVSDFPDHFIEIASEILPKNCKFREMNIIQSNILQNDASGVNIARPDQKLLCSDCGYKESCTLILF